MGVAVFAIHSWSVRGFLFQLPSFILKKPAVEIGVIFGYHLALALLESILATVLLLAAAAALPGSWLKQGFAFKGALLLAGATAASIALQESPAYETFTFAISSSPSFIGALAIGLVLFAGIFVMAVRSPGFQRAILFLVDRISVMLFIYLPLDVLGVAIVTARLI